MELNQLKIANIPGIGVQKAELIRKEIKASSWEDMLYVFPYKYVNRSTIFTISEIHKKMPFIQLKGKILCYKYLGKGKSRRLIATFSDKTGNIELAWFRRIAQISQRYKIGEEYILFGKLTCFGKHISVIHPELKSKCYNFVAGIQGYYHTSEKMKKARLSSYFIRQLVLYILKNIQIPLPETLTEEIIAKANLLDLGKAIRNIHFPISVDALQKAQYRLKFEELFYLQLHGLFIHKYRKKKINGHIFAKVGDYFNDFYHHNLPFKLTNAQKRVVREIRQDLKSGHQMNRLLQGDVGSGKTLVALLSMLIALDNEFQVALMTPTEVLAVQHYQTILCLFKNLNIETALLTSSTTKKERKYLLKAIKEEKIQILVGTHTLIEDAVIFGNLGLVIVDEQHRFGVKQRAKLWKKNIFFPHILVMTATPIPRTLAMTLYGDLDVSVIDELPPGRQSVETIHIFNEKKQKLYEQIIRKQLQLGRQVYIIYPLIKESLKIDLQNLTNGFESVKKIFPEYDICMIHGKMNSKKKEEEMKKFVSGISQIMVATTVIEVGVHISNATVMVIENAERFGLSQLHQLRGRVGRGSEKSFCALVTSHELSKNTRKRLSIITKTNDGFKIAEEDLKLRGPGDIDGTQQSGTAVNLKIAHLIHDEKILTVARYIAKKILFDDPILEKPKNKLLREQLHIKNTEYSKIWGMIS